MNKLFRLFMLFVASLCTIAFCGSCEETEGEIDEIPIYTVTFETNGGSYISTAKVESGSAVDRPTDPTKADYTFVGWCADAGLTKEYDFGTAITADITIYASWLVNTYTVTFDSCGGSEIESQEVDCNSTATEPDAPTKDGYSFAGWYSNMQLTSKWSFDTKISANITLYASWSINIYTVTFESNGGTEVSPQEVEYGAIITLPDDPTKEGCSFEGWYSNADLTTAWDANAEIFEDVILYAKWSTNSYTVTFESNGGSEVESQEIEYNSTASEPTAPTKDGYTFAGWYSDSALSKAYSFTTQVSANITLYAKWSINSYAVTFESNGGSSVSSQTVNANATVIEPKDPTLSDYMFGGWYSDSALETLFDFATPIVADITLYAKWLISTPTTVTITFESNGGSNVSSQTVVYGTTAITPTEITRTGYSFNAWYSDSELTQLYNFSIPVTADITLYAKWTADVHTVTFVSNGGSNIESQSINYDELVAEPTAPTRTGYTFVGWYSNSSLTTEYNFSTIVTGDVILYAKWSINSYTVTFVSNGGSDVSSQTIAYGSKASEPTITLTGYTFGGWYTDSSLTLAYNFYTAVTGDITLYAKWHANPTVTFVSNGGSSVSSQIITYNTTISAPTTTLTGYTFGGWYTDSSLTSAYNFSTAVTDDITLYAKWTINTYSISFVTNGGSSVSTQCADYNTLITEPTTTRTGYTFKGWYVDSGLTTLYNFSTAVTSHFTLYAKWTINTYTVTFVSNGGSSVDSQTITYNTTASEPTTTRTGYTFGGWYTDSSLTSAYNFSTAVTDDITLYAKWTINTYSISFVTNGGSSVSTQYADYNTLITEPTTTRTGYTFKGWYTDSTLTTEWSFNTLITTNVTLYAKWINTNSDLDSMGTGDAW